MSAPMYLADGAMLDAERIRLDGPQGHHAATVRRLRAGERADLTDGAGLVVECVVASAASGVVELDVLARRSEPAARPRVVVVQALPKADRGELAVETMTEVGVDQIVPWPAARCVTQWRPERRAKALDRWRRTARAAAEQSRRAWLPQITEPATTAQIAERVAGATLALILHEEAKLPLSRIDVPDTGDIMVIVGPEGGISPEELAEFEAAGGVAALLGNTVLRTSTAGVAAASVLFHRTGRW
jgi:16S rRNA (uracil1498-N3)-methyltransferase